MINIESNGAPIKAWVEGVEVEEDAKQQLRNVAALPVVWPHVAVMPDVHLGYGATVGSVIPTKGAVIPSAVGVDIGCGMNAIMTNLTADDLPESLSTMRAAIEAAVPHGRSHNGGAGDRGAWGAIPDDVSSNWASLALRYRNITEKHPDATAHNNVNHLGTLGTGNHFIELCLDKQNRVWIMLHSGSRGVGNRIGSYFIGLAHKDMEAAHGYMPTDKDLCYLSEGTQHFDDYVEAVSWAQDYALINRRIMMGRVVDAVAQVIGRETLVPVQAVSCHHNYVSHEKHFGEDVYVTRKGAVYAGKGALGIIPGSMGARSFIVRGKGNAEALNSCSHGAGRKMSRNEAKRHFTVADHVKATEGIECRKDISVLDETPGAYKDIDAVMNAQSDLVEVVAELHQVLCVKG